MGAKSETLRTPEARQMITGFLQSKLGWPGDTDWPERRGKSEKSYADKEKRRRVFVQSNRPLGGGNDRGGSTPPESKRQKVLYGTLPCDGSSALPPHPQKGGKRTDSTKTCAKSRETTKKTPSKKRLCPSRPCFQTIKPQCAQTRSRAIVNY